MGGQMVWLNGIFLHESKKTIEIKIMVFKIDLEIWLVTFDIDYKNLRQLCYPDTGKGFAER